METFFTQIPFSQENLVTFGLESQLFIENITKQFILFKQSSKELARLIKCDQSLQIERFIKFLELSLGEKTTFQASEAASFFKKLYTYDVIKANENNNRLIISASLCERLNERQFNLFLGFFKEIKRLDEKNSFFNMKLSTKALQLESVESFTLSNLKEARACEIALVKSPFWNHPRFSDMTISHGENIFYLYSFYLGMEQDNPLSFSLSNNEKFELVEEVLKNAYDLFSERPTVLFGECETLTQLNISLNSQRLGLPLLKRQFDQSSTTKYPEKMDATLSDLLEAIKLAKTISLIDFTENLEIALRTSLSVCIKRYLSYPFKYADYPRLFETYGKGMNKLNAPIKGGLSFRLKDYFPNLTKLCIEESYEEDELQRAIDSYSHFKSLILETPPPDRPIDLAAILKKDNIESLTIRRFNFNKKTFKLTLPISCDSTTLKTLKFIDIAILDNCHSTFFNAIHSITSLKKLRFDKTTYLSWKDLKEFLNKTTITNLTIKNSGFYQPHRLNKFFNFSAFNLIPHDIYKLQTKFPHLDVKINDLVITALDVESWTPVASLDDLLYDNSIRQDKNTVTSLTIPSDNELTELFKQAPASLFSTRKASLCPNKNRYPNALPYNQNSLTKELGFELNASPVKGIGSKKRRIATQGPLEQTAGDFWEAAFKLKAHLIVMTTECEEKGVEKCFKYWPDVLQQTSLYQRHKPTPHSLSVTLLKKEPHEFGELRTFIVENSVSKEKEEVLVLHVKKWPDQTALPAQALRRLVQVVKALEVRLDASDNSTTIVHCSAGLGRTGSLLGCLIAEDALEIYLSSHKGLENKEALKSVGVNVKNLLKLLRHQRMKLITTVRQFIEMTKFCQLILQEAAT